MQTAVGSILLQNQTNACRLRGGIIGGAINHGIVLKGCCSPGHSSWDREQGGFEAHACRHQGGERER